MTRECQSRDLHITHAVGDYSSQEVWLNFTQLCRPRSIQTHKIRRGSFCGLTSHPSGAADCTAKAFLPLSFSPAFHWAHKAVRTRACAQCWCTRLNPALGARIREKHCSVPLSFEKGTAVMQAASTISIYHPLTSLYSEMPDKIITW